MALLDLLHPQRLQFRRRHGRRRVLDQQIQLDRRLIDRNHERARAQWERVAVAELLHGARGDRPQHDDAVVAELHRVG
ncbi:MAG: hypothetical protein DMD48_01070 [Gemmatimonadetes bacterium]|nr:MAG: hypothetical protein DMD48_01070 [Gemmatimonadota bacterium]